MLLLLLLITLTAHETPVRPALIRPAAAERRGTMIRTAASLRTDRTRVVRVRRRSSAAVTPPAAEVVLLDWLLLRNARLPQLVPRPSRTAIGRRPVLPRPRAAARSRVVLDRSLSRRTMRRSGAGRRRPRGGRISTGPVPVPAPAHPAAVLLLPRDRAERPMVHTATRAWSAAAVQPAEEGLLKGRRP